MNPNQLNGANLAYIGDAYYELAIRKYLLTKNITNQKELHKQAINYVSAKSHHQIIEEFVQNLDEKELEIFKRGRNYKYRSHKNISRNEYLSSSGLEALIGYLYLSENCLRLNKVIEKIITLIEGKHE